MLTKRDGAMPAKRDLHIGGTGAAGLGTFPPTLNSTADAVGGFSDALVGSARDVVHSANEYVRHNPWAAVGLAALAAVTAGYLLTRRN